ncbi:MAG: PKD domain-containing protein, partial [Verrucomicrobia bacterium]|nr:PKD domain-containing protein [Verrucomicrobiota bacterium]
GPFPTNLPPVVSVAASATQVNPGDMVTFTASVQDPNGDTLAFNWDFGDQTFGPNAPVVTNSWATQGQYVVRCEVSDMKGGFASAYVLMVVGTPSVHTISGRVTDIFGNPLQGVRVHNGAAMPATPPPVGEGGNVTNQPVSPTSYRYAYTDSQGNYTIGNIPPGTYSCGAFVYGYKTEALFFNPVDITGADAGGFDYLATPITRLMVQNIQDAPENGLAPDGSTNSGIFRITRDGDLSKDMPVLYRTDGTAVMGTNTTANYPPWDGNWWTNVVKKGNDYITNVTMSKVGRVVILAGQASVDLAVTAIDNTNGNGNQSVIMTLLLATNDFRLTPYLTNVVTTNYLTPGDTNSPFYLVTNSEVHYVTTEVRIPGWELLPSGAEGTLTWFQTDPTYVLSNEDATVWILDDDPPNLPTVSVSAIGDTASKTYNDHGMFMFTRNNAPMTNDLTIYFSVSGSASNGYDYMALPSQVTIKAGESFALLPVEAISSKFVTASETLTINLIPSDTYMSPRGNVTGYPFFSDTDFLDRASLVEKLTSQGDPVSQFLWTNFAEASQQVLSDTNAAAQDQTTVLVDELNNIVFGPSIYESNRFLGVPLSPITRALLAQNPKGYSLMCLNRLLLEDAYPEEIAKSGISFQGGAATLTILSDNLPRVIIYASDSIAFKTGDPGRVTVSRTGDLTDPLAVNYHVSGSAVSGRDFQPLSQRVTIPAGSLTADIVITPINNTIAGVRSVVIQLADSVSYNIEYQDTATVTIQEALPTVTLKANGDAAEGGTSNTFTVTRTGPVTNSLTVYFAVGGSAVEGSDYSPVGTNLVIPVGSNSANILISPRSDSFHEYGDIFGDETVIIQLQAGTNYNLGDPSGGTIHIGDKNPNSDPEVGFMLQGSTVREDVGTVYVLVKCSANPPTNAPINFDYQVIGGTGVQGVNYQLGMWMGTNTLVVAIGTNGVTTNAVPIVGVGRFTHYRQPNPLPDMVSPEDTIGYIPVQIMSDGVSAGNKTVQLRRVGGEQDGPAQACAADGLPNQLSDSNQHHSGSGP